MGHASAAALPKQLTIAGRYRVEQLIGQGGIGAVYAVVDGASGKRLALKRLSPDANSMAAALFEREYHTLAGLKHPCIVEVYDYGSDALGAFYTMELVEGGDLSRAAPMPWREACRHVRDAASLLGLLHARRLVHRDLTPRNLLRGPGGRLKLIDFGALAAFGPSNEVAGTPPFVPPEALRTQQLDQRSDLFSLGALAYWLVTGAHAFPARSLAELHTRWERAPAPPSELLARLNDALLPAIPPVLDTLIASLLRSEPSERLGSTAELIDRLNEMADLEPESQAVAAQGYLDSKAFVGRKREREGALELLNEAQQGRARTLIVEGDTGIGRTRFLEELVVMSRLAGALPIVAEENRSERPYAVAESLLLGLLRALPEPTRKALVAHTAVLGDFCTELRLTPGPSPLHAPAELRVRTLEALRQVVLGLSRERTLSLFVDDVEAIDEESQALLAALARSDDGHRLLIVAALGRDTTREPSAALISLRGVATCQQLLALTPGELLELLRSVFGQVPYLERLAERLHRASDGNPGYCLELARHLVESGVTVYRDGTWSLPTELPAESLPASRQLAQLAKLDRLSPAARKLARSLSVPHTVVLTFEQCCAVSDQSPQRVRTLLAELERDDVLRSTAGGYRFGHPEAQAALYSELDQAGRTLSHLGLGEQISAGLQASAASAREQDGIEQLRACLHFMRAGDLARGYDMLLRVYAYFNLGEMSRMRLAAPMFEEVYLLVRAHQQDDYGMVGVLNMLALASYFAGRRYAVRYGDESIATSRRVLRLALAQRLARFLGGKLALLVALGIAGVSIKLRSRRCPSLVMLVRQCLGAGASLAGTATSCLDPDNIARYADAIEPFAVLGADHVAAVTHRFAANLAPHLREQPAASAKLLRAFLEQMSCGVPIRDMNQGMKDNYEGGMLFALGIVEYWRDRSECLQIADRLERISPLNAMNADQLRSSYYACRGDMERAELFRKRMEVHAVQLGSAWQVEIWSSNEATQVALRHDDANSMKRALEELSHLASEVPALRRQELFARGTYLMLRGKHSQAIEVLERDTGGNVSGSTLARGALARAHNALEQHSAAKQVCLDALARLEVADLEYVSMCLYTQTELALAEAGLGNLPVARRQLDDLLALHSGSGNPLTLGSLHHARAQVALREHDFTTAREQLAKMEAQYRTISVATLIEQVVALRRELERAEQPVNSQAAGAAAPDAREQVMTRVQLVLGSSSGMPVVARARCALQIALELSSADEGFLVLAGEQSDAVVHLGSGPPSPELVGWAQQRMLDSVLDDETVVTGKRDSAGESNYRVVDQTRYRLLLLWAPRNRETRLVAALVLVVDKGAPRLPDPAVIRAIGLHLVADAVTTQ